MCRWSKMAAVWRPLGVERTTSLLSNWLLAVSGTLLAAVHACVAVMGWRRHPPAPGCRRRNPALGQCAEAIAHTQAYVPPQQSAAALRGPKPALALAVAPTVPFASCWPCSLIPPSGTGVGHHGAQCRLCIAHCLTPGGGVVCCSHPDATCGADGQDQAWISSQYPETRLMETLWHWLGPAPLPTPLVRSLMARWAGCLPSCAQDWTSQPMPPGALPAAQIAFCATWVWPGPGQGPASRERLRTAWPI